MLFKRVHLVASAATNRRYGKGTFTRNVGAMKDYLSLLRNHRHPFRFLMARLLMLTGACQWLTIQQRGYRLRFHNSNVAMYRWIAPAECDSDLEFYRAYLKPADVVVDVGANIGETVLTESLAVGDSGRVFAFEPHPRTYRFLQQNLALNKVRNVEAYNLGLGNQPGTVAFTDTKRDDMNRVASDGTGLRIQIETLDRAIWHSGRIQLLKVDVEGYEKFVFEGAAETLRRTQCVFFEVSSLHFRRFGYKTRELLNLLTSAGFRMFQIPSPALLSAISTEYDTTQFRNLVALRDETEFTQRTGWALDFNCELPA